MSLQLSTLGKGFSTSWIVTLVGTFSCVSSQMSLQGLLPGENSIADRALDAAGRLGALDDEGVDGVRPRPPSLRVAALQVRALARVTPSAAARAT